MHVRCVVSACVRVAIVLSLLFIRQRQNKRLPSAALVPVAERKRSIWHIAQVTTTHSRHGAATRLCTNPDRLYVS